MASIWPHSVSGVSAYTGMPFRHQIWDPGSPDMPKCQGPITMPPHLKCWVATVIEVAIHLPYKVDNTKEAGG